MTRVSSSAPPRLNRDASRLIAIAQSLSRSGSRVEDLYWEKLLADGVSKLLRNHQDAPLEAALDHLSQNDIGAYEVLIEHAETLSESMSLDKDGKAYDTLLIVIPIAAWTRYTLQTGPISETVKQALLSHLHTNILAEGAHAALMPDLVSIDQMPRTFSETWQWMHNLGNQSLGRESTTAIVRRDTEPTNMLADTRYIVAAASVLKGAPVFRWQEHPGDENFNRDACEARWVAQAQPTIATLMPGCGIECLLPDAYYISNREADRRVRPLSLRAAIHWLESTLNISASDLRAVIAGCGEMHIEEYRIAFTPLNSNDVYYGCIWPIFGREEAQEDEDGQLPVLDLIAETLKEYGINEVRHIPGVQLAEFCEDCGTPSFPNPLGEFVHAELPEDADITPAKFH